MRAADLRSRLAALVEEHQVPSAALGIVHDGEITEVAAGVVNLSTGVEATPDTVYQIGSQAKSWTATVLMQLADEGRVDIGAPVQTYLPEFRVPDPEVSAAVALRHLLSHTSGIDGDHFEDFGRGDDCLERYVDSCAALGQTHSLGATMSYCNTGYAIAGRVIEVVTGKVWDRVMRERLFDPLGLDRTSTLPEEAILHRVAVGHVEPEPGAPLQVAPVWMLPRACGPMGLINATARDVLAFAQLHLDAGRTRDGTRLLSAAGVRTMQEPQVAIPDPHTLGSHWGLGWILFDWDGHRLYGHDGATIGQTARLRILPEASLAICLLTNGGESDKVYQAIVGELLGDLAGVAMPAPLEAPDTPPDLDLSPYAGTYERLGVRYDLVPEDGRLAGTVTVSGPLAHLDPNPVSKVSLTPVDATTFLVYDEGASTPDPAVFYDVENGVPGYLHTSARANRRNGS